MTLGIFGVGYGMGLSAAAPIGPVNIAIITRALRAGWAPAFFLGCGAVTADCVYFAAALAGAGFVRRLVESPGALAGIQIAGGLLLMWLGWGALGLARKPLAADADEIEKKADAASADSARKRGAMSAAGSYILGLGMTLTNPMTLIFWLSIAPAIAAEAGTGSPFIGVAGVGAGALSWVAFIVTAMTYSRRWVNARFLRWVNLVSGSALIAFGVRFILKSALDLI